jgi:ribosomal-protein-alanine N-acetyltransferase
MEQAPTIFLETDMLLFRQHALTDKDDYCVMDMDPDVRRYVGGRPRSRAEAEKRFMGSLNPITNSLGIWATVLKSENKYIGRCGIYPHFDAGGIPIAGEASLGLYIATAYWGHGYATEAGRAFIKYGFDVLQLDRIVTMVEVGNDASVRVMEKLGLKIICTEAGQRRSFYHYELASANPLLWRGLIQNI